MAKKPLPCPTLLRLLLTYEPETGKLFWKERKPWMAGTPRKAQAWNRLYAGKQAMTAGMATGYLCGRLFDQTVYTHRVIMAIEDGALPEQVDHINGDRADNRRANLRSVSRNENMRNQAKKKNNSSGVTGVSWDKRCKKWRAEIGVGSASVSLGNFSCIRKAAQARKRAEVKYGYHENHGRRV